MNQIYILYNPLSGNGSGRENADALEILYNDPVYLDITQIKDFASFFSKLDLSDDVVLCGGDGTLNRFAMTRRVFLSPILSTISRPEPEMTFCET